MEKPEVGARVGDYDPTYVVVQGLNRTFGSIKFDTEAEAKLIAGRINTDPAEIEARVRKELARKMKDKAFEGDSK